MADMQDNFPVANMGEQHIAVVLLVDTSGSMYDGPIEELNKGLQNFYDALQKDSVALGRAEVCLISFNSSVNIELSFRPADQFDAPILKTKGTTAMNEGILTALNEIEERISIYKQNGVKYYRPWLFLLTDGQPSDMDKEAEAVQRLRTAIENKKVTYLPMGIGADADLEQLKKYYPEQHPQKTTLSADVDGFANAFEWLSRSVSQIAKADQSATPTVNLTKPPDNITVAI